MKYRGRILAWNEKIKEERERRWPGVLVELVGAQLQVGWFWPAQQIGRVGPAQLRNNDCVQPSPALPAYLGAAANSGRTLNPPGILFLSACLAASRLGEKPSHPSGKRWPRMKTPSRSGLQVGMGPLQRFTGDNCLV